MLKNYGSIQNTPSLYVWPTLVEENFAELHKNTNAAVNKATGKLPFHISTGSSEPKVLFPSAQNASLKPAINSALINNPFNDLKYVAVIKIYDDIQTLYSSLYCKMCKSPVDHCNNQQSDNRFNNA